MISKEEHLVGWSLLMYELEEAHEHLGKLMEDMSSDPEFGEPEFRIMLGHVFAHLNRAWHRRDVEEDLPEESFESAGRFPTDLEPL